MGLFGKPITRKTFKEMSAVCSASRLTRIIAGIDQNPKMTRALYRAIEIASPKCQPKRRLRVRRQSEGNARRNTEMMVPKRTEQRTKSVPVARPTVELWCDCRGPYTGALMIQCDNDNCPIQWYHAACLNETVDVSKDWLCEKCR